MAATPTFPTTLDWYVSTSRRTLCAVTASGVVSVASKPVWAYGDVFGLVLHFGDGPLGGTWTDVQLDPAATIRLRAKAATLRGPDLFFCDDFTINEDGTATGALDLLTGNLKAALTGRQLDVAVDVTVTGLAGTLTATQTITVLRRVDADDSPPTVDGVPVYVTTADLAAALAALLRIAPGKRIVVDADGNISTEDVS